MNIFKKCAVKALSLAIALITALSVGTSASAAAKTADVMSNDWSILVVFFKSVDVTVKLSGKTVSLKKTIANAEIDDIKNGILDRMPYQFMQDTHGKVGIDAIDYAYVDEPLTNKDIESVPDTDGAGYRAKYEDSKLVSGVLDECLEQNFYSQILVFAPLGEISLTAAGWGGSKYKGVNIAQILMFDNEFGYYSTIIHEICHGLETDSKALNNNKTAPLHDMYVGNNAAMSELEWYEYYMNDSRPDGKKGVEPLAFYRLRNEKHTPLAGDMTVTNPQNLSAAANSNTAATLSWDGLSGSGYQVGLFKDADHKKLKTTYDVKSGEASFKLTDLVKGNTYYIGVRAASTANGKTYCSDWIYLTYTHGGIAEGVKNFRVEDLGKGSRSAKLKFSWDAVPNASGYQIAQFGSTFKDYDDVYDYKSGKTSAVLGPFTRYTDCYFGIRASETIAGKKVWSDWTYLAFEFWDDIELIDISSPQQESKTPTSILSLSVEIKNQTYTGKALTPDITLKDGSKTLKNGTDYVLIYKNNTEIGIASVRVEAMGDYCDEGTLYFLIVPKKTTLTAKKSGGKITLQWDAVKGAEKYEIYYREKGSSKYKELTTVSGSKTSYSTSKLDKNKTYQFKIRSYAELDGKKYCSSYSKVVTVK